MTVEQGGVGGEEKDGDRRRQNIRRDGRVQRGRGAQSNHENNLPLGGRVEVQVRLYGERGRGGVDRETGTTRIDKGPRASTKKR